MSMNLHERARELTLRHLGIDPGPVTCSWVYSRTLNPDNQETEYKCARCGDTQTIDGLLGQVEEKVCRVQA